MSLCFQNRASTAAGGFTSCPAASVGGSAVSASAVFCSWGMSAIAIQKRLQNDNADGCIHCHLQNEVNTENPICKALKNQKHQVRWHRFKADVTLLSKPGLNSSCWFPISRRRFRWRICSLGISSFLFLGECQLETFSFKVIQCIFLFYTGQKNNQWVRRQAWRGSVPPSVSSGLGGCWSVVFADSGLAWRPKIQKKQMQLHH